MFDISASIVAYNNDPDVLTEAITSFLNTTLNVKLYLVDNSPTDALRNISADPRCEYIFNNKNLGFGNAHNIALERSLTTAKYHLVLNPDIYFSAGVLENVFSYMQTHPEVGQVMPKVLYPNGETQFLCKLLPTPFDLLGRRFFPSSSWSERRNRIYELRDSGYNQEMVIPFLSGCFMFFRTAALKEIGLFDDRIFMYIEDADLTRRMHQKYKTVFYPSVHVFHHYGKGSYKSLRLMFYNIHGAIIYFTKWGWFRDKERDSVNREVINRYIPLNGNSHKLN